MRASRALVLSASMRETVTSTCGNRQDLLVRIDCTVAGPSSDPETTADIWWINESGKGATTQATDSILGGFGGLQQWLPDVDRSENATHRSPLRVLGVRADRKFKGPFTPIKARFVEIVFLGWGSIGPFRAIRLCVTIASDRIQGKRSLNFLSPASAWDRCRGLPSLPLVSAVRASSSSVMRGDP